MRRLLLLGAVALLVGGAVAIVLDRDATGPFPSAKQLQLSGFAAWPVDTVEEAERECAQADEWRHDARATAVRFAREVLGYPQPGAAEPFAEEEHHARLQIGTDGVRGVFLGSVLELDRYGRCWYVTEGVPREGDLGATLGFVYRDGRPHLLLGHSLGLPHGTVGYGDWEREVDAGLRQSVTPLPDLDATATGHAVYTQPDEDGVSEFVGARPLGHVPPPPEDAPSEPLPLDRVVDDREICRIAPSSRRSPEATIRYLFRWRFPALLEQRKGFPHYERKDHRRLGRDRWRVFVDDAVLDATIPRIAGRCYAMVSLRPARGDSPLRRLWIGERSITYGINWGGGDEVSLGDGTVKQIREPVTFPRTPDGEPSAPLVVLYQDGHVVSAYLGVYGT